MRLDRWFRIGLRLAAGAALLAAGGCARLADYARRGADDSSYAVLADKQRAALGASEPFTVDPLRGDAATSHVLALAQRLNLGSEEYTTPTLFISLDESFAVALANNRDYQSRKESLFTQAVALTGSRWNFGYIPNASASANLTRQESDTPAGDLIETFGGGGFAVGVRRLLATGAQVTLNFSHQFTKFLTREPRPSSTNDLALSVIQPLLRGAGALETLEPLRQDEANLLYAVRDFRRFQQEFVIGVAQTYYNLLSSSDQLRNAQSNDDSARRNLTMLERLAQGGRKSDLEVDQARQNFLQAEANLSATRQNYGRQLDQFKLFLGLPLDLDVGPDPAELERIAARGLLRPQMELSEAIADALRDRLDVKNAADRDADSERHTAIAARQLLPSLDASFTFSTGKDFNKDRLGIDFGNNTEHLGLDLQLPLDWTPRRNTYRLALLARQQSRRDLALLRDSVTLEVRDAWRGLEELRTTYAIQQESVRLAERRVRSASLLLQMGRATTRDLLEAQDALLASRNALTASLVSYTIQRLRFWNAIERLRIDPKGMWNE